MRVALGLIFLCCRSKWLLLLRGRRQVPSRSGQGIYCSRTQQVSAAQGSDSHAALYLPASPLCGLLCCLSNSVLAVLTCLPIAGTRSLLPFRFSTCSQRAVLAQLHEHCRVWPAQLILRILCCTSSRNHCLHTYETCWPTNARCVALQSATFQAFTTQATTESVWFCACRFPCARVQFFCEELPPYSTDSQ